MKMGILHVNTTKKPPYRTKINVRSPWLADIGFVHGTPIAAAPCANGFTLSLWDENKATGEGKLIHVSGDASKPSLIVNLANNFSTTGLVGGDVLAAGYEYGTITAAKLPEAKKYCVVSSQNNRAYLQFCGAWLTNAGFIPDAITTVSVTGDGITFGAWKDSAAKYSEIVKYARKHKYQLIQAKRNQHLTVMDIPCYILSRAGLNKGDIVGIRYSHGTIELFKPDLKILGF